MHGWMDTRIDRHTPTSMLIHTYTKNGLYMAHLIGSVGGHVGGGANNERGDAEDGAERGELAPKEQPVENTDDHRSRRTKDDKRLHVGIPVSVSGQGLGQGLGQGSGQGSGEDEAQSLRG